MTQPPPKTLAKLAHITALMIDSKQKMQDKKLARSSSSDDLAAAAAVAKAMADTSESDEPLATQEPIQELEPAPEAHELSSEDAKKILDAEWQNILKRYGK